MEGEPSLHFGPTVSAGAKIPIVPVEKSATPKGSEAGLILETEEGRMCLGGETWMKWWD
jgi:hypothetical protein